MIKTRLAVLLMAVSLLLSGCMSTKVIAKYDSDNIQSHKATRVTLLWGIVAPRDIPAECESNAICKVSAETNVGFILISAATMGIVVPQRVVWDCCAPKIDIEKPSN